MSDLARISGVAQPKLSEIERGMALPRDSQLAGLEFAYGSSPSEWWPVAYTGANGTLLVALEPDQEPARA